MLCYFLFIYWKYFWLLCCYSQQCSAVLLKNCCFWQCIEVLRAMCCSMHADSVIYCIDIILMLCYWLLKMCCWKWCCGVILKYVTVVVLLTNCCWITSITTICCCWYCCCYIIEVVEDLMLVGVVLCWRSLCFVAKKKGFFFSISIFQIFLPYKVYQY